MKIKWHNKIKTMKKTVAVTMRSKRENVVAVSIFLRGDLRIPLWSCMLKLKSKHCRYACVNGES